MSPASSPSHRLFCFGYGYCCEHLTQALQPEGRWHIAGTTRDQEKKRFMTQAHIEAHIFHADQPLLDPHRILRNVTHLLISTPPNDAGDPVFNIHGDDIRAMPNLQWLGYLSSTNAYGDRDGGWVDEDTPTRPTSQRGTRRARAEEQWMSLYKEDGVPVHIFRLAGIYGPGRSALDSVRAGVSRRIDKPGHAFSRVHVDDIVNVLRASLAKPNPGRIYNVCDDNAAPSHELIKYACELLGLPVPPLMPYAEADLAPITRSFYADNKRISNERIKSELGITLKHPDYRSGLDACLEAEKQVQGNPFTNSITS